MFLVIWLKGLFLKVLGLHQDRIVFFGMWHVIPCSDIMQIKSSCKWEITLVTSPYGPKHIEGLWSYFSLHVKEITVNIHCVLRLQAWPLLMWLTFLSARVWGFTFWGVAQPFRLLTSRRMLIGAAAPSPAGQSGAINSWQAPQSGQLLASACHCASCWFVVLLPELVVLIVVFSCKVKC